MKIALITGPTGGIGKATAENLIKDHDLILWCRKPHEQEGLKKHLLEIRPSAKIWLCGCDLSDWEKVKMETKKIMSFTNQLDTLVLNAGQYANPCIYQDGLEINYRAGHLGHMLLSILVETILKNSSEPRIILVSSIAHQAGKALRPFQSKKSHIALFEYADLKLSNRLFAIAWSHFKPNIPAVSFHPGVVGSNFGNHGGWLVKYAFKLMKPFILTSEEGAKTGIWLCRQPQNWLTELRGSYFYRCKVTDDIGNETKLNEALLLWEKSMQALDGTIKD